MEKEITKGVKLMLKIGVVVHGPSIIDSGYAVKIIELLEKYGNITCRLGGTMGRTAVIDANLEDIINIRDKLLPSRSIELLQEDNDIIFLLNSGKSTITGHTFGYKVVSNLNCDVNLIQIERPDKKDGTIIKWGDVDVQLADEISRQLNLPVIDSSDVKNQVKNKTGYERKNNIIRRKIAGVSSGENVMLNGVIVAKATDNNLTIIAEDNRITGMEGGVIKQHGLEKLGEVDLESAVVKTGLLRKKSNINLRILEHKQNKQLKVAFLDHAAVDIFNYRDVDLLVCVGDDTTLLSSDILYRFSIPVIGITDGDLDKVVLEGFKHEKSIIIQLQPGFDDIIGKIIHKQIFKNKDIIQTDNLSDIKDDIINIIRNQGVDYKFVNKQLEIIK